jgi:hypothetical protein
MPPDTEIKNSHNWFKDPDSDPSKATRKDESGLFGWTVLILIFIGIAIACWIGSFYIFGHPEKPLSHQILTRLKKIDPPKRFELTAAPRGEFLHAPQILERYGPMKPRQLARTNETLLRNYIRNYKPAEGLVPYVIGTFNILDSFELTGDDFFPSGVVALAQSKENPKLLIEQIFCADKRVIPTLHRTLLTGLDIDLKRENELASIVNVERLKGDRIKITTVSILYPSYESATTEGTFTLDPPEALHVEAGLPVVTGARQSEAEAKYDHYRRKAQLAGKNTDPQPDQGTPAKPRLMRVEKPLAVNEPTPPPPARAMEPVATPIPPILLASAAPTSQSPEIRAAIPVVPVASPSPSPLASPSPSPSPSPTPASSPSPEIRKAIAAAGARNWPVYEPSRMPRGRLVTPSDVAEIAKKGTGGERIYLQGNFNVTAAGGDRAVLRPPPRAIGFGSRNDNVRIIVQYPNGMSAPSEGASIARDATRPFQIMDVRENTGGQINVYVREVTKP